MILLAHRGAWQSPQDKNSRAAFLRAFDKGYGVELDVRDQNGRLVISHDAPEAGAALLNFRDVLAGYRDAGYPGALAVNIKADGLLPLLEADFALFPEARERCFMFDMSIPESLRYLRGDHIIFTRHSEYEPAPAFLDRSGGVWMDCFEKPWVDPAEIAAMLALGQKVAIVSPELHGRAHLAGWELLRPLAARDDVMLCTDFPDEAEAFFTRVAAVQP